MTADPRHDSAIIAIPRPVFWGLLVPMLFAICGGSWYMAILSLTVANQGSRLTVVEGKTETNKDASTLKTDAINDRLIRMEAQLSFLVKASDAHK